MKRMIVYLWIGTGLLVSLFLNQPVLAAGLTSSSQLADKFSENGKIDQVNFKNESIVIDDRRYKLYTYMRVYKPDGSVGANDLLKKGKNVYFNVAAEKNAGYHVINEIWISSDN